MAKKRRRQRTKRSRRQTGRSGKPKLSVCMVAKDEEAFLGPCLASVKGLADEILVGDTGSSDRTREVARKGGARVLEVDWQGDFAGARNAVLSAAKGDWILVLDCDEVLARQDWEEVRQTAASGLAAGYRMTTRNYMQESNRVDWQACTGAYAEEKSYPGWFPTTKVRLFRNDPRIRFEGALHELVEGSIEAIGEPIGDCLAPIHHYGYVEKERSGARVVLYADAAERKMVEQPENPKAFYELALLRRDGGELEAARAAIERCVDLAEGSQKQHGHYLRLDYAFMVQGDIAGRLGDRAGEERAYLRALEVDPGCYGALNNLGALKQRTGDLEAALGYYEQALARAPDTALVRENIEKVKRVQSSRCQVGELLEAEVGEGRESGTGEVTLERGGEGDGERLSLCMIVKNEEERLGHCLESVQGLVDEIVVVDTGSSDGTVEVAERYGARVGYFEWRDDWAAARNVSLEMATGDWIMWLDADDILPRECHEPIRRLLSRGRDRAYFFALDSQGYKKVTCLQLRLFPNLPGVAFDMPVHEQVAPSLNRLGVRLEPTEIRVVHTGYTTPEVVREKQERYLGIMERWLETHPENYIVRSHVAMTYYMWGKMDRAISHYEKILYESRCRKDRNLVVETTSLLYMGASYMRKEELEKALPFLQDALKLDDQYAMTNATLGECYLKMGEPERALAALERAHRFEDQTTFAANDPTALKYSIRFITGQSLEALGRLEEALEGYRKASVVDPNRSGALGACSTVYRKLGRQEEAVAALEEALKRDPENPKHRFNRGTFFLEAGDEAEARRWFRKALEVDPKMAEPYLNMGFLARRQGDMKTAEEMYRKAVERSKTSYEPMANLGHLLLDQERYAEAGEMFLRVREMQAGLLDVDLGLCVVYAAEGRSDTVGSLTGGVLKAVYGEGLQTAVPPGVQVNELAQLLAECGRMLLQKQLPVCARLAFLAAHLLDSEAIEIALQLAEVYRATGEDWKAVSIYEGLIQKYPATPELFRKLGACYEAMGVAEAAQICAEQAGGLEG